MTTIDPRARRSTDAEPAPAHRRRSRLAAVVTGAALCLAVCATAGVSNAASGSAADRVIEVTGREPVSIESGVVRGACFTYSLPDVGATWQVVDESRGCSTSVVPEGGDLLVQFFVRARAGGGTPRDHADQILAAADPESVVETRTVRLGGRDVVRIVQDLDALRIATYLVQLDRPVMLKGQSVAVVDIGAPYSPWHERVVQRVIASLGAPDGTAGDVQPPS
ncbi:hypothetical protein [Microbacterium ulmi]|uniref:Uncharacterized protein n=1 Tax=Microbacterium ulmi TaxID=179095 RepID=A0A7Y2PYQ4_9MICO|nr:hypothetical protein [Microbacterium ulmi]NII71193.1 hypothetical protein [Microbacterium ulmi]NNH02498.1 hypothetical protein [Microbacterium ulmi]